MQEIKNPVKTSVTDAIQYEVFDLGSKAVSLDDDTAASVFTMIDELGLAGQKNMLDTTSGNIIPYTRMSSMEKKIWENFCPTQTNIKAYSDSLIPYEIMQLLPNVSHMFNIDEPVEDDTDGDPRKRCGELEIWSESREAIDPLLVGKLCTKYRRKANEDGPWYEQSGSTQHYLIARWGHALKQFEDICKIVKERWISERSDKLEEVIAKSQLQLAQIKTDALKYFDEDRYVESI